MSFNMPERKELAAKMKEQLSPVELSAISKLSLSDPMQESIGARIYDTLVGTLPELSELQYIDSRTSYATNNITLILGRKFGDIPMVILWTIMSKLETLAAMHGGVYAAPGAWNRSDKPVYNSPIIEVRSHIVSIDDTVDYVALQQEYDDFDYAAKVSTAKQLRHSEVGDLIDSLRNMYNFGSRDTKSVDDLSSTAQKVLINKIKRGQECWIYTELDVEMPSSERHYDKPQMAIARFKVKQAAQEPAPVTAEDSSKSVLEVAPTETPVSAVETIKPIPTAPVSPAIPVLQDSGEPVVIQRSGAKQGVESVIGGFFKMDVAQFDTPVEIKRGEKRR